MDEKAKKLKELKLEINEFRNLKSFESQQLFIYDHFSEMRIKVDTAFSLKVMNESESLKDEIDTNWLEVIDKIKSFETECQEKLEIERVILTVDKVDEVEAKLNEMLAEVEDKKDESIIAQTVIDGLEKSIEEMRYNLEKSLFLNKTMDFFENEADVVENHCPNQITKNTIAGKLVIIPEIYYTKIQIRDSFKESGISCLVSSLDLRDFGVLKHKCLNETKNLVVINLSNQNIKKICPRDFKGLASLTELNLSSNKIEIIETHAFDRGLRGLIHLNLENNRLYCMYNLLGIFDGLVRLERLNLASNALSVLPNLTFQGLTSLVRLELQHNKLNFLPKNIFKNLNNLKNINLNYNNLEIGKINEKIRRGRNINLYGNDL